MTEGKAGEAPCPITLTDMKTSRITSDGHQVLLLGSASPRRRKLLHQLGYTFESIAPVTEEVQIHDDPVKTVVTNALAKFRTCRALHPGRVLITADTIVWFEQRLIGKPTDLAQAAAFLRQFSGRTQLVFSAVALGLPHLEPEVRVEASSVRFKILTETRIREYLASTEVLDRAGAYDIDERGQMLIEDHSGSYTNIMGLPLEVVKPWLLRNYLKNNSADS